MRERRKAASLARHYRDEESRSIAEIAWRLGRAEATVKAYLYDPDRKKLLTAILFLPAEGLDWMSAVRPRLSDSETRAGV